MAERLALLFDFTLKVNFSYRIPDINENVCHEKFLPAY